MLCLMLTRFVPFCDHRVLSTFGVTLNLCVALSRKRDQCISMNQGISECIYIYIVVIHKYIYIDIDIHTHTASHAAVSPQLSLPLQKSKGS